MNESSYRGFELQYQFKGLARELFATAVKQGLPKGFEGKQLSDLSLEVEAEYPRSPIDGAVETEALKICLLDQASDHPLSLVPSGLAVRVGATALKRDMDTELFPTEAVAAVYSVYFNDTDTPISVVSGVVGDEQHVTSANFFMEECLDRIMSDTPSPRDFSSSLTFRRHPELEISGREGHEFLFDYFRAMARGVHELEIAIVAQDKKGVTPEDKLRTQLHSYKEAARRVRQILKM